MQNCLSPIENFVKYNVVKYENSSFQCTTLEFSDSGKLSNLPIATFERKPFNLSTNVIFSL